MTAYNETTDAQAEIHRIVSKLSVPRRKVLTVRVFDRAGDSPVDPIDEAHQLARHLHLHSIDIASFEHVDRLVAHEICENVASHDLVHLEPLLPREDARFLAVHWLSFFDDDAVFLTNGEVGRQPNLRTGIALSLFGTDLEAGVLAVSGKRVGIFWNSEDS